MSDIEDIELVIKMPEEDYRSLQKKDKFNDRFLNYYEKLIVHGTPLPKGHGDLVYREDVCNELRYMDNNGCITRSVNHVIEDIEKGVPTIIKADKERE